MSQITCLLLIWFMTKIKVTPEFIKAYKMLNANQRRAVDTIEGPVMVVAGPGTGKTQILTLRIANILKQTDTPADAILALTFTEAAASNMKNRLVKLIGKEGYKVKISTFHGFANSIIQKYPEHFERLITSSPMTDMEKLLLLVKILDEGKYKELKPFYDNHAYLKDIMGAISSLKRDTISPSELKKAILTEEKKFNAISDLIDEKTGKIKSKYAPLHKKIEKTKELADIYQKYEQALVTEKLYDFEDMILQLIEAFEKDENFKMQIQEQFLYVLADEHQDANDAQNRLLELLTDFHDSPNLFIVGDAKQAIYRFQGASIENFVYFQKKFNNVTTIELEHSYRSGQEILDASYSLIENSHFTEALGAKLTSQTNFKSSVSFLEFETDEQEALYIAKKVKALIEEGVDKSEIAILCRTNADTEIFAKALLKEGVPFNIDSNANALDDKDIKKLLTLLEAVANFGEDEKLAKALHLEFVNLDELDIYKVIKAYRKSEKSLHEILLDEKFLKNLNLTDYKALSVFAKRLRRFSKLARQEPVPEFFDELINEFGFLTFVLNKADSANLLEKLRALIQDAQIMSSHHENYTLDKFLEHLLLVKKHKLSIGKGVKTKKDAVVILTAHRSKGLEFEYVFIVRAYDGKWGNRTKKETFILPTKNISALSDNDDERRLFFVALTRAKLEAVITFARYSENSTERLPTLFVEEIDEKLIKKTEPENEYMPSDEDLLKPKISSNKSIVDLDYLRNLFLEQGLSVTALNNFLQCPWNFFYSNLIRIPKMQTKHMILGNALHFVLYFMHEQANKGVIISQDVLEEKLKNYINARPLSPEIKNEIYQKAQEYLNSWLKEYKHTLGQLKTLNEYEIETHLKMPEDFPINSIKLTGKLDKLEFINENEVVVVDYKTGQPAGIRAITQGKDKKKRGYFRQLVFYKLLLELDGKFKMKKGVIDFLQPKKTGKMEKVLIEISDSDVSKLKEEIALTVKSIYNLDFWDTRCADYQKNRCEYCALRDLMK